jgi:hypothetical protein
MLSPNYVTFTFPIKMKVKYILTSLKKKIVIFFQVV